MAAEPATVKSSEPSVPAETVKTSEAEAKKTRFINTALKTIGELNRRYYKLSPPKMRAMEKLWAGQKRMTVEQVRELVGNVEADELESVAKKFEAWVKDSEQNLAAAEQAAPEVKLDASPTATEKKEVKEKLPQVGDILAEQSGNITHEVLEVFKNKVGEKEYYQYKVLTRANDKKAEQVLAEKDITGLKLWPKESKEAAAAALAAAPADLREGGQSGERGVEGHKKQRGGKEEEKKEQRGGKKLTPEVIAKKVEEILAKLEAANLKEEKIYQDLADFKVKIEGLILEDFTRDKTQLEAEYKAKIGEAGEFIHLAKTEEAREHAYKRRIAEVFDRSDKVKKLFKEMAEAYPGSVNDTEGQQLGQGIEAINNSDFVKKMTGSVHFADFTEGEMEALTKVIEEVEPKLKEKMGGLIKADLAGALTYITERYNRWSGKDLDQKLRLDIERLQELNGQPASIVADSRTELIGLIKTINDELEEKLLADARQQQARGDVLPQVGDVTAAPVPPSEAVPAPASTAEAATAPTAAALAAAVEAPVRGFFGKVKGFFGKAAEIKMPEKVKKFANALFNKEVGKAAAGALLKSVGTAFGVKFLYDIAGYASGKFAKSEGGFGDIHKYAVSAKETKAEKQQIEGAFTEFHKTFKDYLDAYHKKGAEISKSPVTEKVNSLKEKIKDAKNIPDKEKQEMLRQLGTIIRDHVVRKEVNDEKTAKNVKEIMGLYIKNKVSGMNIAKEAFNTTLFLTPFMLLRGGVFAGMSIAERTAKAREKYKKETFGQKEKKSELWHLTKEYASSAVSTVRSLVFMGEQKGATGKERVIDFFKALGTVARGFGIYGLAFSGLSPSQGLEHLMAAIHEQGIPHVLTENFGSNVARTLHVYTHPGETLKRVGKAAHLYGGETPPAAAGAAIPVAGVAAEHAAGPQFESTINVPEHPAVPAYTVEAHHGAGITQIEQKILLEKYPDGNKQGILKGVIADARKFGWFDKDGQPGEWRLREGANIEITQDAKGNLVLPHPEEVKGAYFVSKGELGAARAVDKVLEFEKPGATVEHVTGPKIVPTAPGEYGIVRPGESVSGATPEELAAVALVSPVGEAPPSLEKDAAFTAFRMEESQRELAAERANFEKAGAGAGVAEQIRTGVSHSVAHGGGGGGRMVEETAEFKKFGLPFATGERLNVRGVDADNLNRIIDTGDTLKQLPPERRGEFIKELEQAVKESQGKKISAAELAKQINHVHAKAIQEAAAAELAAGHGEAAAAAHHEAPAAEQAVQEARLEKYNDDIFTEATKMKNLHLPKGFKGGDFKAQYHDYLEEVYKRGYKPIGNVDVTLRSGAIGPVAEAQASFEDPSGRKVIMLVRGASVGNDYDIAIKDLFKKGFQRALEVRDKK